MIRKVMYQSLKNAAKVEFVGKGGLYKRTEREVLDLIKDRGSSPDLTGVLISLPQEKKEKNGKK